MEIDLELYRREVQVSTDPPLALSVIDIVPSSIEQTIVFVHGFGGRADLWEHQLRYFAERNRVIAPDLRGHGASDAPDTSYSMEDLVSDLEIVLANVNVTENFVLVGHSFGGAIAAAYLRRNPNRVEKLILISTSSRFNLGRIGVVFKLPVSALELIRGFVKRQMSAPAFALKRLYESTLSEWKGLDYFTDIIVPTLVVYGHRDFVFPRKYYEEVAKSIPNAEEVVVPVSAHLVMLERPDAVNRAMERFLGYGGFSTRVGKERTRLFRERPWLSHYETGVPYALPPPAQPLHTLLRNAARRYPRATATVFYDGKLTYAELEEQSNRLANSLRRLGIRRGERVMILLPNSPQCVISYFSVLKAGAVVVFGNPVSTARELLAQIRDCGAKVLITLTNLRRVVDEIQGKSKLQAIVFTSIDEYFPSTKYLMFKIVGKRGTEKDSPTTRGELGYRFQRLIWEGSPEKIDEPTDPDSVAVIQYTGGTTDEPKGVMLSHRNLVTNAIQVRHWIPDAREAKERILSVIPFSHIYGLTACLNLAVSLAAGMILLPTFITVDVLRSISKHRPTFFPGVPTMYVAINNHPQVRKYRLSSIRACVSGAAPLPLEVQEAFEKLTRGKLVEGYGLTEAAPVTHANPLYGRRKTGTIGTPLPSTDARVVSLDSGQPLEPGEIGELCVRGPQVMLGYWNSPDATKQTLRDGWLHTGDLARMDEEGYFQIIDRKKDMIIAGDLNVYPRDVEEVLYEHPKVFEAAVVGVPPESRQQEIRAFIVLKKGEKATAEEFIRLLRNRLPEYKIPSYVEFRQELPKTFVGKILRRALAQAERLGAKLQREDPA